MGKKTKKQGHRQPTMPAFTQADLRTARQHTIALGIVVIVSLGFDGWRVYSALHQHAHVVLPVIFYALPVAAFALFLGSLWSWLSVKKSLRGKASE